MWPLSEIETDVGDTATFHRKKTLATIHQYDTSVRYDAECDATNRSNDVFQLETFFGLVLILFVSYFGLVLILFVSYLFMIRLDVVTPTSSCPASIRKSLSWHEEERNRRAAGSLWWLHNRIIWVDGSLHCIRLGAGCPRTVDETEV